MAQRSRSDTAKSHRTDLGRSNASRYISSVLPIFTQSCPLPRISSPVSWSQVPDAEEEAPCQYSAFTGKSPPDSERGGGFCSFARKLYRSPAARDGSLRVSPWRLRTDRLYTQYMLGHATSSSPRIVTSDEGVFAGAPFETEDCPAISVRASGWMRTLYMTEALSPCPCSAISVIPVPPWPV